MNLKRYCLTFIVVTLCLGAAVTAIEVLLEVQIRNAGMALIPIFTAAMLEGQKYAQTTGQVPESSEMWRFSRQVTLVVVGFNMVVIAGLSFVLPELRWVMTQSWGGGAILSILLVVAGLAFFMTRQFLAMGAKGALKAEAKKTKSR